MKPEAQRIALATLQSKAELFDKIGNEFPVDPNFRWVCMDTRIMTPKQMKTSHLFNCIKMLWNHWTPVSCRIEPYTRYTGIERFPKHQRAWAVTNLYNELMNRSDRTEGMNSALERMRKSMGWAKLTIEVK